MVSDLSQASRDLRGWGPADRERYARRHRVAKQRGPHSDTVTTTSEIDGPFAGSPNTVRVNAGFPDTDGLVNAVDTQFDVFASC
jgi:hypothetical protein